VAIVVFQVALELRANVLLEQRHHLPLFLRMVQARTSMSCFFTMASSLRHDSSKLRMVSLFLQTPVVTTEVACVTIKKV
jgi:hypothetical protein